MSNAAAVFGCTDYKKGKTGKKIESEGWMHGTDHKE
jgi:hypothetical protein